MTGLKDTTCPVPAGEKKYPVAAAAALGVMLAAFVSRLPAMGAWWNQDDWGLLARAAGLIPDPQVPIRWLSQTAYWRLMWPLAGLDPAPYAFSRLLLHALAAGGVVRLAARLQLAPAQQWLAGLVMAATPLAFTPLYWAAGVQDLLAVACLVWSLERWLSGGRAARPLGALLALGAVAAKETVIGLPLLLGWLLWRQHDARRRPLPWVLVALVLLAAAAAAVLALRFFATGPAEPYALGGFPVMLSRLLIYGLWLLLPGPSYPPNPPLALALAGGLLWLAWSGWALHQWRRQSPVPMFALLGALLMLWPLLPLKQHLAPDLAYPVEPFGCLALGSLWPRRVRLRPLAVAVLVALTAGWGFFGMRGRIALRDQEGLPADPVVRRTAVSAAACRHLRQLPPPAGGLVIVQPPLTRQTAAKADELGERWIIGSTLYHSLNGTLGPRVLLGLQSRVVWANGLRRTPENAFVLFATDLQLVPWGLTKQALLYQTLTDLGLGLFARARLHLLRASLLAGPTLGLAYDEQSLPVPLDRALANLDAFLDFLARDPLPGLSEGEIMGLQTNLLRLLSVCTGRAIDDLAPGRGRTSADGPP